MKLNNNFVSLASLLSRRLYQPRSFIVRQSRSYISSGRPNSADIYDVICVGGGPAGLTLVTSLLSDPVTSKLRIALVETQDMQKVRDWSMPPGQFANRCSSLTPSSAKHLRDIGAWASLCQDRIQEYDEMQVWDGISGARVMFEGPSRRTSDYPDNQIIAYMIENSNLTSGLLRRLDDLSGESQFRLLDKAKITNISYGSRTDGVDLQDWPVVELASGKNLYSRLLVGADGANSPVRSFSGITSRGWDYNKCGVVASLDSQADNLGGAARKIAYQRFLPTGPLALLPMPGNKTTLVWSTTKKNASLLKSLSPTEFTMMINAGFRLDTVELEYLFNLPAEASLEDELRWRLGQFTDNQQTLPQLISSVQEGSIAMFPLKFRHSDSYIGERIALVGDAAHTVHPLAGQGLNQGQGDVQSLTKAIKNAVVHGQDIGALLALEPYNAERYLANHVLSGVCDKLHKLYTIQSSPIVALRSIGLSSVNAISPLKEFLMKSAAWGL